MKKILIFGGSGFLGSSITKLLLNNGYEICVVCRNLAKAADNLIQHKNLTIKKIDIFAEDSVKALVAKHDIIINLIGKLYEEKKNDFQKYHVDFPQILASYTKNKRLIHLSALAIESSSTSSIYAKTKLAGEQAIIQESKNYTIIKPSIIFGENDNFFNLFARISKFSPFLPLIGGGKTLFSPIYVEDIANSILVLCENSNYKNQIFEAYGDENVSFKEILEFILQVTHKKRMLVTLPFKIAKFEAKILHFCKIYLLTEDQVELLKYDNISTGKYNNINSLKINLTNYKDIVPNYLK